MPKQDRNLKGIKMVQEKEGWVPQRKLPISSKIQQQINTQWAFIGKDYKAMSGNTIYSVLL